MVLNGAGFSRAVFLREACTVFLFSDKNVTICGPRERLIKVNEPSSAQVWG
jgi:hypothetical protein